MEDNQKVQQDELIYIFKILDAAKRWELLMIARVVAIFAESEPADCNG